MSSGKTIKTVHRCVVVDASDMVVGKLATKVAQILMGKHKPTYSPHLDHGDNVVVINCQGLQLTGKKYTDKRYVWHTGYSGSLRSFSPQYFADFKGDPGEILYRAVRGMVPKNNLRDDRMFRLTLSKDLQVPSKVLAEIPPEVAKSLGLVEEPKFPVKTSAPLKLRKDALTKDLVDRVMDYRRSEGAK